MSNFRISPTHSLGAFADRPGPVYKGQSFFATDTGTLYTSDGTTWTTASTGAANSAIKFGGSTVATEPSINIINGTGVTLTITDNPGAQRTDVEVGASGGGGGLFTWVTKTANYTVTTGETGVLVDTTGGAITITLPTAIGAVQTYNIKKKDSSANAVTVNTTSSQTIDGSTTYSLSSQYQSLTIGSDGSNWYIQ